MKWLLLLMALIGFSLTGCGDDNDYYLTEYSGKDTVVGTFALSPASRTDVVPGSLQESQPEPVNIYGPYAEISVINGEYSVNFGSFVSGPGIVRNRDVVMVRHTAATAPLQTVTTTLQIGDKSAQFSSTTGSTPGSFGLNVAGEMLTLNVPPSSPRVFGPVVVSVPPGFEVPISITEGEYSINGGPFTATPGTLKGNDEVLIRHNSADGLFETTVTTTATIGIHNLPFASSTASVATQKISVTAPPSTRVTATVPALSSGTQSVLVWESFFVAQFSFDNEVFYDVPAETRYLSAGQLLYLSDYSPSEVGRSNTSVIRIGDKQTVLFEVIAM